MRKYLTKKIIPIIFFTLLQYSKATYKLFSESNCYLATTTSGWFNSKSKVLTGSFDEFEDNSPSLCVKNCAGNGFMLAGVENGNGCYCGDEMPDER